MWYAFNMDEGLKYISKTKKEIMNQGYKTREKYGKGDYELINTISDGLYNRTLFLYDSKEKAKLNGWDIDISENTIII